MNNNEQLNKILQLDPRAKFIRLDDPIIGTHQNIGKLKVEMVYSRGDNRGKYYYCKCDCGKYTTTQGNHFRKNHTKSCGCYMIEHGKEHMNKMIEENKKYTGYDLTGQIINNFKINKKIGQNDNHEQIYECICPCCNNICYKTKRGIDNDLSCGCIKKYKGEEKIIDILINNNIPYIKQKTFLDCRYTNVLPFDFYINNKYLIEYDGIQHYKSTGGQNTKEKLESTQEHDNIKNEYCKKHNIPLIRIPYTHLDKICLEDLLLETTTFRVI